MVEGLLNLQKLVLELYVIDIVLDSKGGEKIIDVLFQKWVQVFHQGFQKKERENQMTFVFFKCLKPWQIMIHSCRYVNIPS